MPSSNCSEIKIHERPASRSSIVGPLAALQTEKSENCDTRNDAQITGREKPPNAKATEEQMNMESAQSVWKV